MAIAARSELSHAPIANCDLAVNGARFRRQQRSMRTCQDARSCSSAPPAYDGQAESDRSASAFLQAFGAAGTIGSIFSGSVKGTVCGILHSVSLHS